MSDSCGTYVPDMARLVKIVDLAKIFLEIMVARGVKFEFVGLRHGERLHEARSEEDERQVPIINYPLVFRLIPNSLPPGTSFC
jgi:FlaA1/EpsC-like NDP-sugar epimerase